MGRKRRVKNTTKFDSKNSSLKQALTQNKDLSERLEAITASIAPPSEVESDPPPPKKTTRRKTATKAPKRTSTRKKRSPAAKSKTSTTK